MLREKVIQRQRALGWSDVTMARTIGIPRSSYHAIARGEYEITLRVARLIVRAFPDLEPYVLATEESEEVAG